MKNQLRYSLLIVAFAMGCQKTSTVQNSADLASLSGSQSVSCQSGPTTDVAIQGLSQLKSGQKTTLSLSPSVNCQDAQTAQWKIGNVIVGTGPEVQAQINGTGIYKVSVIMSSQSLKSQNKTVASYAVASDQVAVTDAQILLVGPQIGIQDQDNHFSLSVPQGVQLSQATWDFGDGSPSESSLVPVVHAFPQGTYTITVSAVDTANQVHTVRQNIVVLPIPEGRMCSLEQLGINGPVDVPMGRRVTYSINLSTCLASQVTQAIWNFGDGTAQVAGLTVDHAFSTPGTYTITAQITLYGQVVPLTYQVVVKDTMEQMPGPVADPNGGSNSGSSSDPSTGGGSNTSSGSGDSGSVTDPSGSPSNGGSGSATDPSGTPSSGGSSGTPADGGSSGTPSTGGSNGGSSGTPSNGGSNPGDAGSVTDPSGTPSNGGGSSSGGSNPGPVTDPVPDNNKCPVLGATRTSDGAQVTESQACGLNGTKTNTYRTQITQTCQTVNGIRDWVQTSSVPVLVSEGACHSQSCELTTADGKQVLHDGESRILYSSQTPAGTCGSVQETRTCNNGVLTGSSSAQYSSCHSGCGDFGVHGTVKSSVITGEIQQPVTCQFGETGVISIYNQVSDMTCQDGQVVTSNTRQGDIKQAGVCPTYQWVATDNWSQCSADCGGTQSRVYECRNNSGQVVSADRCQGSAPVESRVCDGNPDAVKRTESSSSREDAPSCGMCPANKIGVITQYRDITVTKTYACVNHQVQLANTQTQKGAWVKESYCRDFTPYRCSQDSLSNQQARGRFNWMVKCENSVPAIKEFITNMKKTQYEGYAITKTERLLYPTFMDSKSRKPWIAPTSKSAECNVPATAYVAAVCVSSCSTPEQTILAEAQDQKLKYTPFVDALTQNLPQVATLRNESPMSSKTVVRTKVDNWVTEMLDTDHQILVFRMQSGGILKLTLNHPMLTEDGSMKLASDFKVGESFVLLGGKLDTIASIEQTVHHGKVYNLFVKSDDLKRNIVVVNGYLSGTAFYQNEGAKFVNRDIFRQQLTRGVFSRSR